jgi:hypothetical protein
MIEDDTRYQAQIAEPHSLLSAVTDHLLFDELDKFGVWDIIEAATDVVFAAWKIVSVGVTDEILYHPIYGWRTNELETSALPDDSR